MARPRAKELTERELEVMHVFWERGECAVPDVQNALADAGVKLAYTTVATLVHILAEKGFLQITHRQRPYRYRPARSYREVSGSMLTDVVDRLFGGSRERLLVRLLEQRKLTAKERALLEEILREGRS